MMRCRGWISFKGTLHPPKTRQEFVSSIGRESGTATKLPTNRREGEGRGMDSWTLLRVAQLICTGQ